MAKILVIEDDPTLQRCYHRVFREHEVTLLHSNPRQIKKAIPKADVVISDFHVPGVDFSRTKEYCDKIKKPLVLVSASAPNGTHQHQLEKPFNLDDLVNKVDSLIR